HRSRGRRSPVRVRVQECNFPSESYSSGPHQAPETLRSRPRRESQIRAARLHVRNRMLGLAAGHDKQVTVAEQVRRRGVLLAEWGLAGPTNGVTMSGPELPGIVHE